MTWLRRCTVVVAVLLLGIVAATVQPEPASANYTAGLVDAIQTSADYEWVKGQLYSPSGKFVTSSSTTTNVPARWASVRLAAAGVGADGLVATAGITVPTIAVAAAGLYLGWEIGHASGLSGWFYGHASGLGDNTGGGGVITAGNWANYTCSAGVNDFTPCQNMGLASGDKAYVLTPTTGLSPCASNYATTSWEAAWNTDFTCSQSKNTDELNWLTAQANSAPGSYVETGDCTGNAGTNDCYGVFMTLKAMTQNIAITESGQYNSTNDVGKKTSTISSVPRPAPPEYGTAGADAIEEMIEDDPVLAPEIGTILHPSTDTGTSTETLLLPQPRLNETYGQYANRLRAAGFLGTITRVEEADPDVEVMFGPNVVTRIETATDTMLLTDPWPVPPPTLTVPGTDAEITVTANPSDSPAPAPDEPGGASDPPPGNAPPPGGDGTINVGDCSCPAPDFGPVSDIDYGSKFPLGIFAMVSGVLGTTLYASPDAPVFDIDMSDIPTGDHGELPNYTVDLDILDAYMTVIRTMISWVMWIGGLWWFGSRLFGFDGTGDPGGAVEEAWD